MVFNTSSACGGVIPLKSGPGLALGFNTLYHVSLFSCFHTCHKNNSDGKINETSLNVKMFVFLRHSSLLDPAVSGITIPQVT